MRIMPLEAPARTMFARQAELHRRIGRRIGDGAGVPAAGVGELDAHQQPAAAHVADAGMLLLQRAQAGGEPRPRHARLLHQPVALHDLEHLQADRGGQRVVDMRRVEQEAARLGLARDRRRSVITADSGRPAPSVFDRVRMSGTTPSRSKANIVAGAADAGLRLVEDQQHAARAAMRLQRREIAGRQLDDAAAAQDRLGDEGGEIAGALLVDQLERIVELLLPRRHP